MAGSSLQYLGVETGIVNNVKVLRGEALLSLLLLSLLLLQD
jgi:hypothetical protein